MVFSDTSTKLGLIQDITFLTNVDLNKYPIADRTRNVNSWSAKIWTWIFAVYGGWQFDDAATPGSLPASTINLVSGTANYALPSDILTVRKIEVLQSDGETWKRLAPLPLERIGNEGEFLSTNGTPFYYRLTGEVTKLYPAPNYSGDNYLKVFFDRGMTAFAADNTTETPGFASIFHRALSTGASLDYAVANGVTSKIVTLGNEMKDYESRIKNFYRKRFIDNYPPQMRVNDNLKEYL